MRNGHEEARVLLTVGQLSKPLTGRHSDAPAVTREVSARAACYRQGGLRPDDRVLLVVHTHASLAARWRARRRELGLAVYARTLCLLPGHGLICPLNQGQAELPAVDGDAMPPSDLSREHPEVASRLTREFLALYETTDRLMRENRLFPIDPGSARTPRAP
jgi:hypothetical protein